MRALNLLAISSLIVLVAISGCIGQQNKTNQNQSIQYGRAVFSISDKPTNISTISEVKINVEEIEVHNKDADQWTEIPTEKRSFDLLYLKSYGIQELFADVNLTPGTYSHILIEVESVTLKDSEGIKDVKLPSNKLLIITDFNVTPNSTTFTNIDFILDKSLHRTGNGKYILMPVLKVDSYHDAEQDIMIAKDEKSAKNIILTKGIEAKTSKITINQGTNIQGALVRDFELDEELDIDEQGFVKIKEKSEVNVSTNISLPVNISEGKEKIKQNFIVTGDDVSLDPKNITVKKGANVTIKFVVSKSNVYYGGLNFKGPWGETGTIMPGASGEVLFIANQSLKYTSYWPQSDIRKADGFIDIEE